MTKKTKKRQPFCERMITNLMVSIVFFSVGSGIAYCVIFSLNSVFGTDLQPTMFNVMLGAAILYLGKEMLVRMYKDEEYEEPRLWGRKKK